MELFGPPSPPPWPSLPAAQPPGTDRSAIALWPPVAALTSLVDTAIQEVRLYRYRVPEHLADAMDLQLKHVNCRKIRAKHPWINLEDHLWESMPNAVWTDEPDKATFFVVPHAFLGHQCMAHLSLTRSYVWNGLARFFEVEAEPV